MPANGPGNRIRSSVAASICSAIRSEIVNDLSVASLNQMAALSKLVCPPFFELHCSIH